MKKKFLKVTLAFTLLFTFVVVNAAGPRVQTTPAKAMGRQLEPDEQIYAVLDTEEFEEFGKFVSFSNPNGNDKVQAYESSQKILITQSPNWATALAGLTPDSNGKILTAPASTLAGDNWFTAYCLDGNAKYPQFTIYNMNAQTNKSLLLNLMGKMYNMDAATKGALEAVLAEEMNSTVEAVRQKLPELNASKIRMADYQIGATTLMAVLGNKNLKDAFNKAKGHDMDGINYIIKYNFLDPKTGGVLLANDMTFDLSHFELANSTNAPANDNAAAQAAIASKALLGGLGQLNALYGTGTVKVLVKELTIVGVNAQGSEANYVPTTVSADELRGKDSAGANVDGYYTATYSGKDILFDKYDSKDAGNYKHALWIIEHSYPSMTLDAFYAETGVNGTTLASELTGLYSGETFNETEVANLVDNFVYTTVQYAIWYANNSSPVGKIGDTLYLGSLNENNELNKIYKYLTKSRDEYTTYGEVNYNVDKVVIDETNKDKVTEKGDSYFYGPFKASYNVIAPQQITYTIESNNKSAVSIVDKDGNALEKLNNGQEFYVKCTKAGKVTNVKLTFNASGKSYKKSQKGSVLYANFVLNQNVITGLGYEDVNGTGTSELVFNPKTGVPNIAIVFVITLIAFSLGYLALSYNNKPVELQ